VEFLVQEKGKGKMEPYFIEPVRIPATGLRYMEILTQNRLELLIPEINAGIPVPSPSAYIIQKILINDKRKQKGKR
jgi:hypothetical protein